MGRKKKVNTGEMNRYFDPRTPLKAPESGYVIQPLPFVFEKSHAESKFLAKESSETPFEDYRLSIVRGKRQFSYPVMSLLVKKDYGPVKEAMEEMIAIDCDTEHKPFIVKDGDEYKCIGGPQDANPFKTEQAKMYDPKKSDTIAEQLSAGKAAEKGDVFEWRTNMY